MAGRPDRIDVCLAVLPSRRPDRTREAAMVIRTGARGTNSLHVLPRRRLHDASGVFMQARQPRTMTVQSNEQAADRLKIDVRDAWELRWWCRKFGCTETQLRAAIDAIGAIAGNVRKYLAREQARQ
jgi:hypothetical protein